MAILMHGGIIKVGSLTAAAPTTTTTTNQAAQPAPQAAKTEAQIVNGLKAEAQKLGLDMNKFSSCLDSGSKASLVKADLDAGTKAGVTGTPSFFINGRNIPGAAPFDQFKSIIDEELNGTAAANAARTTVDVGDLPIKGNQDAKVTMVEFSDYQCPFCEQYFTQTDPQIKKDYIDTGKVKFYYRDYPLSAIHPGAEKGAEAARCAGDQGKYWQYHDQVFQDQNNIF